MGKTSGGPALEIGEAPLAALVASSKASSSQMEALASAALAVLLGLQEEAKALGVSQLEDMEPDLLANTYNALVCLFLESAKLDLSYADLLSFLRSECRFAEGAGEAVSQMFADRKEAVRALIATTATSSWVPRLVGAGWSLDYCVSSSEDRALRELLYHVSLSTLDPVAGDAATGANFVCTVEELQDLVTRLKDACKSVERAVQSH